MLATVESRIRDAVDRLLASIADLPAEALYKEPADGEWPVMSTLAHVVEMLPYWAAQAERIAQHPGTNFGRTHDDPGRLGAIAAHAADPVELAKTSLQESRDDALRLLRQLPDDAWGLSGQHPTRGAMTIDDIVTRFMVTHVEEHCAQVSAALRALGYSPSQVP